MEVADTTGENTNGDKTESPNESEEDFEEDEESEKEEDKEWNAFLDEKRKNNTIEKCEGLKCFLNGEERWKVARDKLDQALEKYTNKSNESMKAIIHDLIKNVQASSYRNVDALSADCKSLLVSGYRRRNACLEKLQETARKTKTAHEVLVARTMDEDEPASEDGHEDIMPVSRF